MSSLVTEANRRGLAQDALGISVISDSELRARFDRFLGGSEVTKSETNAASNAELAARLLLAERKLGEAWEQLHILGELELVDGGVSRELANRIDSLWNTDRAAVASRRENQSLEHQVRTATRNADSMSRRIREAELRHAQRARGTGADTSSRGGGNSGGVPQAADVTGVPGAAMPSVADIEGRMELTAEYLRSLDARARMKLNELRVDNLLEQTKSDFAAYITTLFEGQHYRQVILAADFYRRIFDVNEYPVEMGNQVTQAIEAGRQAAEAVSVFAYRMERDELVGATQRLQEAFLFSPYDLNVLSVARSAKDRVMDHLRAVERLRNQLEARDFGALEESLAAMETSARDFDRTKANGIVNAVKLESRLRLGKPKLAAQQGNLTAAMEEFEAAAQAWPGNPELENAAEEFFTSQDVVVQGVGEFDRHVTDENYRAIWDDQLAFAAAVRGDDAREGALRKALETVKAAEMALEKANAQVMAGDHVGAWETIEVAATDWPEDSKLNRMRADLAGRSAEFVAALNRARAAETRGEEGFALTLYVHAQGMYPPSHYANDAIERLVKEILEKEGSKISER